MIISMNLVPGFGRIILGIFSTIAIVSCSGKTPKNQVIAVEAPIATTRELLRYELECYHPQFSYRGDQILYVCEEKKINPQPQLYLEDLNTGFRKQVTFQDGQLKEAHFLRPDFLVYLSSSDTRKEHVPLLTAMSKPADDLEVYSLDLQNDEIERITENKYTESLLVALKHIQPKIAFVRIEPNTNKVILKNLVNKSEKLIFQTNHPITEIAVTQSNQIIVVEDTGYKKWVRLIENDTRQTLWPEFKREAQSFYLDAKTGNLEYLENSKVKSLSLKNLCISEVFSFPTPVLEFKRSPVVDNLYLYTIVEQGLRRVEKKVIPQNPAQPCKKIVRRR